MIKTVLSSLFAVFLFALGAAGSWYFVEFQKKQAEEQSEEAVMIDELTTAPVSADQPAEGLPGLLRAPAAVADLALEDATEVRDDADRVTRRPVGGGQDLARERLGHRA